MDTEILAHMPRILLKFMSHLQNLSLDTAKLMITLLHHHHLLHHAFLFPFFPFFFFGFLALFFAPLSNFHFFRKI